MRYFFSRLSLLLFLLISSASIAQKDFREGFIITTQNDTIFGFIDYRSDYLNCNKCVFKENIDKNPVIYLPGEIKAYRFIDSKYFISYYLDELDKKVFIEYLIDGIVDIFYYRDYNKSYYYVNKEDSELYALKNDNKEFTINGKKYIKASNQYIGTLKYLFEDSKITQAKLNYVGIDHKSLINIAKDYHNYVCKDEECIVFEKKLPLARLEYSVLFFTDFTSLNINGLDEYSAFNYPADINFSPGLGLSLSLPRLNERVFLYAQGIYESKSFNSSYFDDLIHPNYFYSYNNLQYLNINVGFKYFFPKGQIRPDFIVGWSNNVLLKRTEERIKELEAPAGIINTYNLESNALNTSYNGFVMGIGLNFFKTKQLDFSFNLQYNFILGGNYLNMSTMRAGFGIKY